MTAEAHKKLKFISTEDLCNGKITPITEKLTLKT